MKKIKIAYIGMSHLGLISAIGSASKGYKVICFDNNLEIINKLKSNNFIYSEPNLNQLFEKFKSNILFTNNLQDINQCDLVYIAKDVPTDDKGNSDLFSIISLIDTIKNSISDNSLLIILSQVPPGFTNKILFDKSRLFYQVETLIFGKAIERTLNPERFIIGSNKKVLPKKLSDFLNSYNCPICIMKYESAELSKIAINMFLVSSVSTTNTIAEMCEKIGANWDEINPVLKLDKRIGNHAYLKPGLGIAGGNLERDLATFKNLAKIHKTEHSIIDSWKKNSQHRANWALSKFNDFFFKEKTKKNIGILGLAYKENTNSIKNSCSLKLMKSLKKHILYAYDPIIKELPNNFNFVKIQKSIQNVYENADLLIIMTPWEDFKELNPKTLFKKLKEKLIIDPYGILNNDLCQSSGLKYYKLGI